MPRRSLVAAVGGVIATLTVTCASSSIASAQVATEPDAAPQQVVLDVKEQFRANYLLNGEVTVSVSPAEYIGKISVVSRGEEVASTQAQNGSAQLIIPAEKIGTQRLRLVAADDSGFVGTAVQTTMVTKGVRLRRGDRHPVVPQLMRNLKRSKYLVPRMGKTYNAKARDVVMAFQKVNELPRTGKMNEQTWQALAKSGPVKPRYRGSGTHLEVDKTRQVMMLVRNGKVRATLHVSTGKTGNTPEGRYPVFAKGVGNLYRFISFKGNFGIHGYVPVPAQPASAGCVREPMWAADWFYKNTSIGTPVYIYR